MIQKLQAAIAEDVQRLVAARTKARQECEERGAIAAKARRRERARIVAYLRYLDEPQIHAAADLIEQNGGFP